MPDKIASATVMETRLDYASNGAPGDAHASRTADINSPSAPPPVTVHVVHTRGTPDRQLIWDRLGRAIQLAGVGRVVVVSRCLATLREACQQKLHGSPTILIDGRDPWGDLAAPCGVHSRSFLTDAGTETAPSIAQLIGELRRARTRTTAIR